MRIYDGRLEPALRQCAALGKPAARFVRIADACSRFAQAHATSHTR